MGCNPWGCKELGTTELLGTHTGRGGGPGKSPSDEGDMNPKAPARPAVPSALVGAYPCLRWGWSKGKDVGLPC